jgi:hypothetical protein
MYFDNYCSHGQRWKLACLWLTAWLSQEPSFIVILRENPCSWTRSHNDVWLASIFCTKQYTKSFYCDWSASRAGTNSLYLDWPESYVYTNLHYCVWSASCGDILTLFWLVSILCTQTHSTVIGQHPAYTNSLYCDWSAFCLTNSLYLA